MKHKIALLLIVISFALILIGSILGLIDVGKFIANLLPSIARALPAPQITNIYVTNPPNNEGTSKTKKRSRKTTEKPEPQTTESAPVVTNVRPTPEPQPVREVVWRTANTNNLSNNRFEIVLPVHLEEFDSRIWVNANQNVMVKYDSSSSRGRIRYEVAGERLPVGEKKEGDSNNNWSDSIKIINEEPLQDAFARPYILIVTMEESKPRYSHNDCVKLVNEVGGNLRQVPSDCMSEWEDYKEEKERRQEQELAETRRQNERRQEDLERERLRKQEQRDRMIQQGVSTIERLIKKR